MRKRLYLETDVIHADELRIYQRRVALILEKENIPFSKSVFDEIISMAWQQGDEAWEAVKRCDEIYSSTSLVPISGYNTYTGAPVIFDTMMQKSIEEDVTGKSLFFLRPFDQIEWDQIDIKLLKKCFKKNRNKLFTLEWNKENNRTFQQVDIKCIK